MSQKIILFVIKKKEDKKFEEYNEIDFCITMHKDSEIMEDE